MLLCLDDQCGFSVAVSAERFAFACPGKNAVVGRVTRRDAGVVYVYTVSKAGKIAYEANLTHTIGAATSDRLGGAIDAMSMFGNTLVVGMTGYESTCKPYCERSWTVSWLRAIASCGLSRTGSNDRKRPYRLKNDSVRVTDWLSPCSHDLFRGRSCCI
jgi:hypothetical protein